MAPDWFGTFSEAWGVDKGVLVAAISLIGEGDALGVEFATANFSGGETTVGV